MFFVVVIRIVKVSIILGLYGEIILCTEQDGGKKTSRVLTIEH